MTKKQELKKQISKLEKELAVLVKRDNEVLRKKEAEKLKKFVGKYYKKTKDFTDTYAIVTDFVTNPYHKGYFLLKVQILWVQDDDENRYHNLHSYIDDQMALNTFQREYVEISEREFKDGMKTGIKNLVSNIEATYKLT